MKILIITRIYTALEESLAGKQWQPKGMPAYYKLIEELDKRPDIETEAVCLGKIANKGIDRRQIFRFGNLKADFHVVPYGYIKILQFSRITKRINSVISGISQFFYCLRLVVKNKYDLIYVDRVNVVYGAIFSFCLRRKVVMRFFGVASLIANTRGLRKWTNGPFQYLSHKAPFAYVICSKDGSGAEYFFRKFLNKNTKYEIVLNGVDRIGVRGQEDAFLRTKYDISGDSKILLFLSRLDKGKGADVFIKSLAELYKRNRKFFALIVGDGPLRPELESDVEKYSLSNHVKFEKAIPHDAVYDYYNASDVYVSLNSLGNLCNTVLEAMNAGKCIVTFKADDTDHTDEDTEELLKNAAVFIDKRRASGELPDALNSLMSDEAKIHELARRTERLARKVLLNWEDRMSYEIELLKNISGGDLVKDGMR